eukprot:scaffold6362_cov378-Prasinococcus_capsulatus_cf.AAC.19
MGSSRASSNRSAGRFRGRGRSEPHAHSLLSVGLVGGLAVAATNAGGRWHLYTRRRGADKGATAQVADRGLTPQHIHAHLERVEIGSNCRPHIGTVLRMGAAARRTPRGVRGGTPSLEQRTSARGGGDLQT